jgi:hypothetical protein
MEGMATYREQRFSLDSSIPLIDQSDKLPFLLEF